MRNDPLRRRYTALTPFERAMASLAEAAHRGRVSEITLLAGDGIFAGYWTHRWAQAAVLVAATGICRAMRAQCHALEELDCKNLSAQERENLAKAAEESRAWMDALQRLEMETGAPFTDMERILAGPSPADADAEKDAYTALREVWDAWCKDVNREDRGRRLPPLEAREDNSTRRTAARCMAMLGGIETTPPEEQKAEYIVRWQNPGEEEQEEARGDMEKAQ